VCYPFCRKHGKASGNETPLVHHPSRRRGGRLAARGARAEDEAADHWIAWRATPSAQAQWTAAFVQRLRELGWVEGQTVAIEYRWGEGRSERSPEIIAEFVRLNVDVIVTHATSNVLAAKQVTSVVPIVFPSAGDPVGNRLVTSLARPGGNVTGLSVQSSELAPKVVELLRDLLPNLGRLAMMYHIGNPVTALQTDAVKAAGPAGSASMSL
jgi:putative ABC transport system substrate-binding protein